eukprot:gene5851-8074_t
MSVSLCAPRDSTSLTPKFSTFKVDLMKMSHIELRDLIDEQTHKQKFLLKSQDELQLALENEPEDRDFQLAYQENLEIINLREEDIIKLKEYLFEIYPGYYEQVYLHQARSITQVSAYVGASEPSTIPVGMDMLDDEDDTSINGNNIVDTVATLVLSQAEPLVEEISDLNENAVASGTSVFNKSVSFNWSS